MEQLLLHLIGDYIFQTGWMAENKVKRFLPATVHAIVYSLLFLLLRPSLLAFATILVTHFFIDRYRLARYVVFAKNWLTDWELKWADCKDTGYYKALPTWLATWLLIICDNTMHLTINYLALKYL